MKQSKVAAIVLIVMLLASLGKLAAPARQAPGGSKRPRPTPAPAPTPTPRLRTAVPVAVLTPTPTPAFISRPKPRPTPRPAPMPSLSPSPWPVLKGCEFETAKVDAGGQVTERRRGQAQYFTEELGDGVRLEMVAIPRGSFPMGSPESEKHRLPNEGPLLSEVTVPSFYMSRFEVTQAQWRVVARWSKVKLDLHPTPSAFSGDHRPVECVLWAEAMEFCARLSRHTGRSYRLPSEAEWEYACRAGTTTPFAFGEAITSKSVNFGNYPGGSGLIAEYPNGTTPVGYFGVANAFGLYDMHGNVWEWCLDAYHASYRGAPTDGSAWDSQVDANRVRRGGSWGNPDRDSRSARRSQWDVPDLKAAIHGFRVLMSDARPSRSRTTIK